MLALATSETLFVVTPVFSHLLLSLKDKTGATWANIRRAFLTGKRGHISRMQVGLSLVPVLVRIAELAIKFAIWAFGAELVVKGASTFGASETPFVIQPRLGRHFFRLKDFAAAPRTTFFLLLSQDNRRVSLILRPFGRRHDFKAHLAKDVHFGSHVGTECIKRPRTSMAVEATLMIHFILDGDFFGLIDSAAATGTPLVVFRHDDCCVCVDFGAFIGAGLLLTHLAVELPGVNSHRSRVEFPGGGRALKAFLMEAATVCGKSLSLVDSFLAFAAFLRFDHVGHSHVEVLRSRFKVESRMESLFDEDDSSGLFK